MPELPEVETIRRQLQEELVGFSFSQITTTWPKSFQPSYEVVRKASVGRRIAAVERQAKLLIFHLAESKPSGIAPQTRRVNSTSGRSDLVRRGQTFKKDIYLLFHLKLTGRLLVRSPKDPPDEFTRSVFFLEGPTFPRSDLLKKELRFADARKFGFIRLISSAEEMEKLVEGYGPEPFKDLDFTKFKEVLSRSSRPVKIILMDQEKIAGVGNIYANEALWLAKINPRLSSNKVGSGRLSDLYEAVLRVLKLGLKFGGASDNSYVQVHGEKGKYQDHFLVYGRQNQPCSRCRSKIVRVTLGGRGTFYCPACQK